MIRTLIVVALACLSFPVSKGYAQDDEDNPQRVTGLFHIRGRRGEIFADKDGNISDDMKADLNTITGWSGMVESAKSATVRIEAARTIVQIAAAHGDKQHTLTATELTEGRMAAGKMLKSKDDRVRWCGLTCLQHIGTEKTNRPVLDLLKDKNTELRLAAISALVETADDACVEPIVSAFKTRLRTGHQDQFDREALPKYVDALEHVGSAKAKKALEDLEANVRDVTVKEAVRIALDRIAAKPKE